MNGRLIFLLCFVLSANCKCKHWSQDEQSRGESLFVHFASGRLGTRLSSYIILLLFRWEYLHHCLHSLQFALSVSCKCYCRKNLNLKVAVDKELMDTVIKYFDIPGESILPVLEDIYCEKDLEKLKNHMVPYKRNEPHGSGLEKDFLALKSKGFVIEMWPEGPPEESTYWIPEKLMTYNGIFIRNLLTFKPEYKKFATNMLKQISKSDRSGKEILFVGMHARRTDYINFSKKILNKKIAGKNHFLEGMEYFKEEFPDQEVYFIAVSDDMDWMRKHLGNIHNVVLAGMADKNNEDKIPYGLDPIGIDLCLLANCNHTILSQGQFGQWGSFLAGGDIYSTYGPMVWNILKNSDG